MKFNLKKKPSVYEKCHTAVHLFLATNDFSSTLQALHNCLAYIVLSSCSFASAVWYYEIYNAQLVLEVSEFGLKLDTVDKKEGFGGLA